MSAVCLLLGHCPGEWRGIIYPVAYCTRTGCRKLLGR